MISIILPAYNERESILPCVEAIHGQMQGMDYEILVVDDMSTDGTGEAVRKRTDPRVRAVNTSKRLGLAESIGLGLSMTAGDTCVIMDSDLDHDPRMLQPMLCSLESCDWVSASRFMNPGGVSGRPRYWLSWVFNQWACALTGMCVSDALYGFFAFRRSVVENLPMAEIFVGHGDYAMRLWHHLLKNNIKTTELPARVGMRQAGRGNRRWIRTLAQYSRTAMELATEKKRKRHV